MPKLCFNPKTGQKAGKARSDFCYHPQLSIEIVLIVYELGGKICCQQIYCSFKSGATFKNLKYSVQLSQLKDNPN